MMHILTSTIQRYSFGFCACYLPSAVAAHQHCYMSHRAAEIVPAVLLCADSPCLKQHSLTVTLLTALSNLQTQQ